MAGNTSLRQTTTATHATSAAVFGSSWPSSLAPDGQVYTPLREGRGAWPDEAFEQDVAELLGVPAKVISLRALKADKSEAHGEALVAAKERADLATLSRVE